MTRDEAAQRLKEGAPFSALYDKEWENALSMAIDALQERRWIPVSEKLPEGKVIDNYVDPSEPVLVQLKDHRMEISRYWTRFLPEPWIDLRGWHQEDVVAWMPLPEPYAEEESNDYS